MKKIVILLSCALVAIPGASVLAADTVPVLDGAVFSSTVVEAVAKPPVPGVKNRVTHRHGVSRPVRKDRVVPPAELKKALAKRAAVLNGRIAALEKSRKEATDRRVIAALDFKLGGLRSELADVNRQERALTRSPKVPGKGVSRR